MSLKFTGLHAHSCWGSPGDGLGAPQEHIDFAIENGMNSLALSDHGNMVGLSHQYFHSKKLKDKGVDFKPIYGSEVYFIPSLKDWADLKEKKKAAKAPSINDIGDQEKDAKEDLEEVSSTLIENEEESKKSNKFLDPIKRRNHLVLLAKNQQGLKSLFKITSMAFIDGYYYYPRVDFELLKKEAKGNIIASSACVAGADSFLIYKNQLSHNWDDWEPNDDNKELIQAQLKDMIEAFKDALGEENYYLELQFNKLGAQHLKNYHIIEAAKRTNTKLIVTCDSHYSRPEHWREREIYRALAWMNKTKSFEADRIPQTIDELKCELYPKNGDQVWQTYKETTQQYDFYDDDLIKEAIERTYDIAHDQIDEITPDRTIKLPSVKTLAPESVPEGSFDEEEVAFDELVKKAAEGLHWRKKADDKRYVERLMYELEVVEEIKFAKYFLTYAKIIEIVSDHVLVSTARGSAGGSLLAFCLGITNVDPIRFNLLFERFLSRKKKNSAPDIDQDYSNRDIAVKLIADYFGEHNVINVTNFVQLKVASLVKDLSKLYGIPFEMVNAYTSKMQNEALEVAKQTPGFDRAQWEFTIEDAERDSPSFREFMEKCEDEYPDFNKTLKVLFRQMRQYSTHAGGVIITDNGPENMPIIKVGGKLQTPWPEGLGARHLEDFGLLKFDVLGLGTLRTFIDCIQRILAKERGVIDHGTIPFLDVKEWYHKNIHPDNNPLDDQDVYENVFWNRKYAGIFQFINPSVQQFASEMKPTCIEDLSAITSTFRPGPLSIKADKKFLVNRQNPEQIEYKHELLEEVLGETSGLIIYQEQLQLIYHKLAGVPLEDTDKVRKAFTKKDLSNKEKAAKDRENLKSEFIEKCLAANNIPEDVSKEIFEEMELYCAYLFNKSHAIAYMIVAYQCAWLQHYYPDEWVCSFLETEEDKDKAFKEIGSIGYKVSNLDILKSTKYWNTDGENVFIPMGALKGVGDAAVEEILRLRKVPTTDKDPMDPEYFKALFEDFFYDLVEVQMKKGTKIKKKWKFSKFNKRALEALIKCEALDGLLFVGEGRLFENYAHMHRCLIENWSKKEQQKFDILALAEECNKEDWTDAEKIEFQAELIGTYDKTLLLTDEDIEMLEGADVHPISDITSNGYISCWFILKDFAQKKTKPKYEGKEGKPYYRLTICDIDGSEKILNYFGFVREPFRKNAVYAVDLMQNGQWINSKGVICRVK